MSEPTERELDPYHTSAVPPDVHKILRGYAAKGGVFGVFDTRLWRIQDKMDEIELLKLQCAQIQAIHSERLVAADKRRKRRATRGAKAKQKKAAGTSSATHPNSVSGRREGMRAVSTACDEVGRDAPCATDEDTVSSTVSAPPQQCGVPDWTQPSGDSSPSASAQFGRDPHDVQTPTKTIQTNDQSSHPLLPYAYPTSPLSHSRFDGGYISLSFPRGIIADEEIADLPTAPIYPPPMHRAHSPAYEPRDRAVSESHQCLFSSCATQPQCPAASREDTSVNHPHDAHVPRALTHVQIPMPDLEPRSVALTSSCSPQQQLQTDRSPEVITLSQGAATPVHDGPYVFCPTPLNVKHAFIGSPLLDPHYNWERNEDLESGLKICSSPLPDLRVCPDLSGMGIDARSVDVWLPPESQSTLQDHPCLTVEAIGPLERPLLATTTPDRDDRATMAENRGLDRVLVADPRANPYPFLISSPFSPVLQGPF